MKNVHFARAVAGSHDRAKARGVRGLPKERFYPAGYGLPKKLGRGRALVGRALVCAIIDGRTERGKEVVGLKVPLVVALPKLTDTSPAAVREAITEQINSFNFGRAKIQDKEALPDSPKFEGAGKGAGGGAGSAGIAADYLDEIYGVEISFDPEDLAGYYGGEMPEDFEGYIAEFHEMADAGGGGGDVPF